MLTTITIVLAVLIGAVLVFAAIKPDTFQVQRSISINASPDKIFPLINDFHHWPSWSPWEKLDVAMKKTHSGAASGVGAIYEWDGNNKVGAGRMEITAIAVPSKVAIKLDFVRPFEGHNTAEFTLEGKGEATNVTWVMRGPSPFIAKIMGVFVSMDSMIGKDFDAGLANMKAVAEQ